MKSFLTFLFLAFSFAVYAQECEITVQNVTFEASNSMTFDVFLKNTGGSPLTYSHGSYAWTYDVSLLNGGTPAFTLIPGFSDFPAEAHPPSALITSPNILRTSSNMPGSNGAIAPDQSLRLYRFRLQTSAASFSSQYFNLVWKSDVTPYTRLYSWNSGSGLPAEVSSPQLINQFLIEENFAYGEIANPDITAVTSNWLRHSGAAGPGYITTSLSYPGYTSSGVGGAVFFTKGASGVNDGDVNRTFDSVVTDNNIYASFLLNVDTAFSTADYFFHFGPKTIGTNFRARLFARLNTTGWSVGLSKSTETRVDDNTVLSFDQSYLLVLKYTYSTATTTDDIVTLYVYDAGIPVSEPGTPLVTIGPIGAGLAGDLLNVGAIAIRQGTNTPTSVIDGIRIGTTWEDIFPPVTGDPVLIASPPSLSGFNYAVGSGPSASQYYNLSGSSLTPSSGSITVTGSTNYEVSLNNTIFSPSVSVLYVTGTLAATPIYVRLKAGLSAGTYNGQLMANSGGGAPTVNVTCNGSVIKPEPTNHVTNFTGVNGVPAYSVITLSWSDAIGPDIIPDGYLVRASSYSFDSILVPIDGSIVANGLWNQNALQGVQTVTFSGLNADRTYYFKIFPYTNSGTLIDYKIDGIVPQFSIATSPVPSLPLVEKFEYPTGSDLTGNGWVGHSSAGINPIKIVEPALTYPGYFASGQGKSVFLTTSGEDVNKAFDSVKTGSVYSSFMVKVDSAKLAGDYFFHIGPQNTTSLYYAKVFVKDSLGNIGFGIAKNQNSAVVYTACVYQLNTTYLIVAKYTYNNLSTTDDEAALWINPVLNGIEPTPDLIVTDAGTDALSFGMVALRQGSTASAAAVTISGIRVAETWIPGSSASTFQLSVTVANGWNMVSIPGLHPVNQTVLTWWPGKDPQAAMFGYSSGYIILMY
jgi:hypothetical protein